MKNSNIISALILMFFTLSLTSCSVIADIFKAGMGFGIFIVVAVIGGILYFIFRGRGKG